MKLRLICTQCATEHGAENAQHVIVEQQDSKAYRVVCANGHEFAVALQNQKFEILFESGAMALIDGYNREAVSSFAASLERFLEFFTKVVARENGVEEESFRENWKLLSQQSERQLGAYSMAYLIQWKTKAPYLEGGLTKFRNKVIHKGYIPTVEEVLNYGEAVKSFVEARMADLREVATETIGKVTLEHIREQGSAHTDVIVGTMCIPMILSSMQSEPEKKSLQEELKDLGWAREFVFPRPQRCITIRENGKAEPATAEEIKPFRHDVLRPGQPIESVTYLRDEDPTSGHFCCRVNGEIVAVASVISEPLPDNPELNAWRIRGMATSDVCRGKGFGSRLVEACTSHVISRNGEVIWCTARTGVVGFYERFGFEKQGVEFEIKGAGPHYIMLNRLS